MKRKCWTIAFFLLLLCMAGMLTAGAAEAEEVVAAQLPTPVLTSAAVYGDSVQLCWEAVEGAEVYRVFRMDSKKMWRSIGDGYDGVYWDDEVESGNTYTDTVRCLNRAGTAYTSGFDGKGVSVRYVAPAEITEARSTDQGVKLSWKAVKGAEKYVVKSCGYDGIGDVLATTTATTFTDANVTSGKAYGYLVKTADKNGDICTQGHIFRNFKKTSHRTKDLRLPSILPNLFRTCRIEIPAKRRQTGSALATDRCGDSLLNLFSLVRISQYRLV